MNYLKQLWESNNKLEEAEVERLGRLAMDGDLPPEQAVALAKNYIRLGLYMAYKLGKTIERDDEYSSCALFAIAKAVKGMGKRLKRKLEPSDGSPGSSEPTYKLMRAYVIAQILKHIRNYSNEIRVVHVPKEKQPTEKFSVFSFDAMKTVRVEHEGGQFSFNMYETFEKRRRGRIMAVKVEDIREVLELSCQDDRDREIVKLRAMCYTDQEIADMVGTYLSDVFRRRLAIEERYNRLMRK